jgi:hypothetical protein
MQAGLWLAIPYSVGNGVMSEPKSIPLAIVWHSRTGTARALAHAAHEGAGEQSRLLRAEDTTPELLASASGYIFACPENLATMSGTMKEMFDRCYYPLLDRIEGRPYATLIAAGSDGTGAQRQIDRIVTGWRLKRVAEPMIVTTGAQTPEAIMAPKRVASDSANIARELGQAMAEAIRLGIY